MDYLPFLLFVALAAWGIWETFSDLRPAFDRNVLLRVDEEFRQLLVRSEDPAQYFDGTSAQIVEETREGMTTADSGHPDSVRVYRYARNAHGEYFYFISEGKGKPYFKHISKENARIAPQEKIRPATSRSVVAPRTDQPPSMMDER